MKKVLFVIFCLSLVFAGCESEHYYEHHVRDFSTLHWKKGQKVELTPEITDNSKKYQLTFAFRHVYGFQFGKVKIRVTREAPSGEKTENEYVVPVVDENEEYLSVCAGDICDLETVIEKEVEYPEKGKYTYTIEHLMPIEELPNVMEVGLILDQYPLKE